MRTTAPALLLALALALTACGEEEKEPSSSAKEGPDPCSFLTIEDASTIVGITYGATVGPEGAAELNACTYQQQPVTMPFRLVVSGGQEATLDGLVKVGNAAAGSEAEQEKLEVPGADEATLMTWLQPNFAATAVYAVADGKGYSVMLNGDRATAVHLMARVLGEPVVAAAGAPLDKPCQAPDAPAASKILGAQVTAKASADYPAATICEYTAGEAPLSASLVSSRGAGSDLDQYWAENVIVLNKKAEPRDIDVPGADAARLVHETGAAPTATAVAMKGDQVFQATVSFADIDLEKAVTELLRYAVGSGGMGAQ
ncbi:hypothetical protein [Nocardioides speluncae]|uniref:hypothetical protein n=1 Tax=Nocardioides speluncae TaxID=2670337 RepID=UPI000D687B9B|nr:hypothetical protein [Nocardioides speluncae]